VTSPYATQLLDDFELRDNLAEVSLYNSVTGATTTGIKAVSRALNYKEVLLGVAIGLQPTDQVWMLGGKSLATPEPQHVIIAADGTRWTILTAQTQIVEDTPIYWECVARKQP